eukprot:gene2492-biopygen9237
MNLARYDSVTASSLAAATIDATTLKIDPLAPEAPSRTTFSLTSKLPQFYGPLVVVGPSDSSSTFPHNVSYTAVDPPRADSARPSPPADI